MSRDVPSCILPMSFFLVEIRLPLKTTTVQVTPFGPSIEGLFIYKQSIFINAIAFMSSFYLMRTKTILTQMP